MAITKSDSHFNFLIKNPVYLIVKKENYNNKYIVINLSTR